MEIILRNKIKKESITKWNFLCDMLMHSSKRYPKRKDIVIKLEDLYNSSVRGVASRLGNSYTMNFVVNFLNPKYCEKDFLKDRQLSGNFYLFGNSLCVMPEELFPLYGLKVLRAGWKLGDLLGSRFEPAHSLAMGLKKEDFALPLEYSQEDILRYLKGETLSCAREVKGWCGVLFGRFPVGLGKASDGVVKNHYPKGLRRR